MDFGFARLLTESAPTVLFTLKQAFASTVFAVLLGVPAGFLVAKRKFVFRRAFALLSAVPFCMPTLLIALSFVLFYGMNGAVNKALEFVYGILGNAMNAIEAFFHGAAGDASGTLVHSSNDLSNGANASFVGAAGDALYGAIGTPRRAPKFTLLYSFWGIVLTHGFYDFPIVMRMCADAWARMPRDEADAARMLGASEPRVFVTVTLFQLAPTLCSASILVFLYCFFSFVIVLLFGSAGVSTIEVELYSMARSVNGNGFSRMALLSCIETLCALTALCLYAVIEKKAAHSNGIRKNPVCAPEPFSTKTGKIIAYAYAVFIGIFFCGPLFSIVLKSFGSFGVVFARKTFAKAVTTTVFVALCTSVLCTVLGTLYALFVHRFDRAKKSILLRTVFPMLPMAVSPIALGFALTVLTGRGSVVTLVCAQTALSWPFAYRQLQSGFDRIPPDAEEAAALLGTRFTDTLTRFYVPLCRPSVVSALCFSFAVSAGDASLPLVLAIARFDNLALFTYRLSGAYRFNEACAAGLVLVALSCGVFFLGSIDYGRLSRLLKKNPNGAQSANLMKHG